MNGKEAIDGAAPGATGARGDEHGQSIGGDSVQAHDTPGGAGLSSPGTRRYTASMETITGRGFAINRGYGEQWAVPLKFWHLTRRNLRASAAQDVAGDDTDGTEGEQLPLTGFGGTA